MKTDDVGIAVIGAGGWGKNIVRSVAKLNALRMVVDADEAHGRAMAEQYGCEFGSLEEALAKTDIHGVIVAVPERLHFKIADAVLRAGKDVYVEKPLALSTSDGQKLVDFAEQENRVLMVGHLLQYHNAFIKLLDIARNGDLGRLTSIVATRMNFGTIRHDNDVLWSLAPHDISMILALAGEAPETVSSFPMPALRGNISDATVVHMDFSSGLKARVQASWLNPYKERRLTVVGDRAMAVFDELQPWDQMLKIYHHSVAWKDGFPKAVPGDVETIEVQQAEPLGEECAHFIRCIASREKPRTDGREAVAVLSVLEKASPIARTHDADTGYSVHETAIIDGNVNIGAGTKIWQFSHVLTGSTIGQNCVIGQNVVVGPDTTIGNRCKIQNNVSLYKGVHLADGVFCGPSCVFTNVVTPRAEFERKNEFEDTIVGRGATIGANATIVCGNPIGAYALIAAGAVVTREVLPHALVAGVPAKQIGWVSHAGRKLGDDLVCPEEGRKYKVDERGMLVEIS